METIAENAEGLHVEATLTAPATEDKEWDIVEDAEDWELFDMLCCFCLDYRTMAQR
jgi:hypothetical protein